MVTEERRVGLLDELQLLVRDYPWRLALGSLLDFTEAAGYYGIFAFLPLIVLPRIQIAEAQVPLVFPDRQRGRFGWRRISRRAARQDGPQSDRDVVLRVGCALDARDGPSDDRRPFGRRPRGLCPRQLLCHGKLGISVSDLLRDLSYGVALDRHRILGRFGRLGAALAPLALVSVAEGSSVMMSFVLLACFYLLGALVMVPWILRGPEGRGKPLEALCTKKP